MIRAGGGLLVLTALLAWIDRGRAAGEAPAPPAAPEPARRPPAVELRTLGVLGGDADVNLSCFLLRAWPGASHPTSTRSGSS